MSDIVIIISLLFFFTMIGSLYFILSKKHKSSSNENFNNYETFREKDNTQKIPLKENEGGIKKEISLIYIFLKYFDGYSFIIIIIITIILGKGTLSGFLIKLPTTILLFFPLVFSINELFIKRMILKERVHIIRIIIGIFALSFSIFLIKLGAFGLLINI